METTVLQLIVLALVAFAFGLGTGYVVATMRHRKILRARIRNMR